MVYHSSTRRLDTNNIPSTGILSILGNNQPPDDAHTGECRRVIQAGEEDMKTLGHEIEAAETYLQNLKTEQTDLGNFVDMHKQILQSPRKLNSDVLSEIFDIVCYSDDNIRRTQKDGSDSLDVRSPRWALGQVCSLWRTIINTQMPRLWTEIDLVISPKNWGPRSYVMDRFLRRSAGRMLDVSLYISKQHDPHSTSQRLLSQFLHSCDRWRTLHFEAHPAALGSPTMDWHVIDGNLPSLKKLSFNFYCPGHVHVDASLVSAFNTAPKLRSAIVNGWSKMPISATIREYKWVSQARMSGPGDVTVVAIHSCRILPDLLQKFHNLETCEVDAVFGTHTKEGLINLPYLQSLKLHGKIRPSDQVASQAATTGEIESLLSMSTFPALTSLTLTGKLWESGTVVDFLERSNCALTKLELPFMGNEGTARILSRTPHLSALIISNTEATFLPFLEVDFQQNSGLCLSLETLILDFVSGLPDGPLNFNALDVEALMIMFESRRRPLATTYGPNKQAHLHTFMLGLDDEILGVEGMQMLRDSGLGFV